MIIFNQKSPAAVRWLPRPWALLPGGELCSILIHDICLRCDGPFRVKPQWYIHAHASSCLFRLCFCSVTQMSTISLVRCSSSSFGFPCHCVSRRSGTEERHLSVMSRDRRRKRHPRHHQVAERRGCAGTGPLQRSVIHDTIKLLNGDAGLWVGVVTRTRKTHIVTFFVDVF